MQIALTTDAQQEAFERAKELVDQDDGKGFVDARRNERGRNAGEVTNGEVVRILSEAYAGRLAAHDDD